MELKINKELVCFVAKNARLVLKEEELEKFTIELEEIISKSFNKLDELEVSNIEPSFQPVKKINHFRKDSFVKNLSQEEALKNVASFSIEKGFIKGPKVL